MMRDMAQGFNKGKDGSCTWQFLYSDPKMRRDKYELIKELKFANKSSEAIANEAIQI